MFLLSAPRFLDRLLLAADPSSHRSRHYKARTQSHSGLYVMTFLFDFVETVVLCQVLWCSLM